MLQGTSNRCVRWGYTDHDRETAILVRRIATCPVRLKIPLLDLNKNTFTLYSRDRDAFWLEKYPPSWPVGDPPAQSSDRFPTLTGKTDVATLGKGTSVGRRVLKGA